MMKGKLRIDVFFPARSSTGKKPRKIAEAIIDGRQGKLHVLESPFEKDLKRLFDSPLCLGHTAVEVEGVRGDAEPRKVPAWSAQALAHLVQFELNARNMRAEVVRLGGKSGP